MENNHSSTQLTLPIKNTEQPCFDNFMVGQNGELVARLKLICEGKDKHFCYLYGKKGCGVSHLLQAMVQEAEKQKDNVLYLSLSEANLPPILLEGLEHYSFLCLDHIQFVLGNPDWEEALFHLFNRIKDNGRVLVIGSENLPDLLNLQLPDLKSRLNSMLRFQLHDLSDEQKEKVLVDRSRRFGLDCPVEVARFLVSRSSRSLNQLMNNLDRLDQASLAEKRPLTIPFVKEILKL